MEQKQQDDDGLLSVVVGRYRIICFEKSRQDIQGYDRFVDYELVYSCCFVSNLSDF